MTQKNHLRQILTEAETVGIVNPSGYFLPPMTAIACAVNPITPNRLTTAEFNELEQVLEDLKGKVACVIDEAFVRKYVSRQKVSSLDGGWRLTATKLPITLLWDMFSPGPDVVIGASDLLLRFIDDSKKSKLILPCGFKVVTLNSNAVPSGVEYVSRSEAAQYF